MEDEEVRFVGCVHQAEQTRGRGEGCPRRCEEDEITTKQSIDGILHIEMLGCAQASYR